MKLTVPLFTTFTLRKASASSLRDAIFRTLGGQKRDKLRQLLRDARALF